VLFYNLGFSKEKSLPYLEPEKHFGENFLERELAVFLARVVELFKAKHKVVSRILSKI
jgi:hypothetical protein